MDQQGNKLSSSTPAVTWVSAREELVRVASEASLKLEVDPCTWTQSANQKEDAAWAFFTVTALTFTAVLVPDDRTSTATVAGLTLTAILACAALMAKVRLAEKWELRGRLSEIAEDYRQASLSAASPDGRSAPGASSEDSSTHASTSLRQGSPMMSIVAVYRDGQWHRVPVLCAVKGDLVALETWDPAPGKVENAVEPSEYV